MPTSRLNISVCDGSPSRKCPPRGRFRSRFFVDGWHEGAQSGESCRQFRGLQPCLWTCGPTKLHTLASWRHQAPGPGEMDLLLPLRDPRCFQPLCHRLDGGHAGERGVGQASDRGELREISSGVPGPLRVHSRQPCFSAGILPLVQPRTSPLRPGLAHAGHGALQPNRPHLAPASARAHRGMRQCFMPLPRSHESPTGAFDYWRLTLQTAIVFRPLALDLSAGVD
jgi:hypothetical protein